MREKVAQSRIFRESFLEEVALSWVLEDGDRK